MDKIRAFIKRKRKEKGYSFNKFAELSGISNSTLHKIESGEIKSIKIENLCKIAQSLDFNLIECLAEAGYISQEYADRSQKVKHLENLTDDELLTVQRFVDFLILEDNRKKGKGEDDDI